MGRGWVEGTDRIRPLALRTGRPTTDTPDASIAHGHSTVITCEPVFNRLNPPVTNLSSWIFIICWSGSILCAPSPTLLSWKIGFQWLLKWKVATNKASTQVEIGEYMGNRSLEFDPICDRIRLNQFPVNLPSPGSRQASEGGPLSGNTMIQIADPLPVTGSDRFYDERSDRFDAQLEAIRAATTNPTACSEWCEVSIQSTNQAGRGRHSIAGN